MDTGKISGRYAKAAYEFALESSEETRLYEEMKLLASNFESFRDMKSVLSSPEVKAEDKIKILTTAAGINVSKSYACVLRLLAENNRESYAYSIALMYGKYYRQQKGMTIAHLTTAETASEETKIKLKEIITRGENLQVDFKSNEDKELIGGFVLRLDDYQLDASIKTQLSRMEKQLIEAINEN